MIKIEPPGGEPLRRRVLATGETETAPWSERVPIERLFEVCVAPLEAASGAVAAALLTLRDLTEHATRPEFVYVHQWRLHDLVMWDNRQTMHRVRRYDQSQPRDMRRATVAGTAPTVAQQAAE